LISCQGTSWLIGSSLAEVLTSIIFLFFKYPYDVGDRVIMDGLNYTVKEIRLLNTLFLDSNNALVLAPNVVVNQKVRVNSLHYGTFHLCNCYVYV
jgi:small-conductance mechanosensitive channel